MTKQIVNNRVQGILVYPTGNVIIPSAVSTILSGIDEVEYNTGSFKVRNKTHIIIPPGINSVFVSVAVRYESNSAGSRNVTILKNGANNYAGQGREVRNPSTGYPTYMVVSSSLLRVKGGDSFSIELYQDSGVELVTYGGAGVSATWVNVYSPDL